MKELKHELNSTEKAAEALVLARLIEMTRVMRASRKQSAEVAAAAAKYEGQFTRHLEELKPA